VRHEASLPVNEGRRVKAVRQSQRHPTSGLAVGPVQEWPLL
jgi:hypothetical protein